MNASRTPAPLASIVDAQGHEVSAWETRSGLLVILTRTPGQGLRGGHPALNREQAAELRDALDEYIAAGVP